MFFFEYKAKLILFVDLIYAALRGLIDMDDSRFDRCEFCEKYFNALEWKKHISEGCDKRDNLKPKRKRSNSFSLKDPTIYTENSPFGTTTYNIDPSSLTQTASESSSINDVSIL